MDKDVTLSAALAHPRSIDELSLHKVPVAEFSSRSDAGTDCECCAAWSALSYIGHRGGIRGQETIATFALDATPAG